jgi:hypothetical protein
MESGLFLDVIVRESSVVFKLLSSEDESLLIWGDSLFVLNLGLYVVDGIGGLNVEGDGLSGKGLDEDLHSSSESENKVKG